MIETHDLQAQALGVGVGGHEVLRVELVEVVGGREVPAGTDLVHDEPVALAAPDQDTASFARALRGDLPLEELLQARSVMLWPALMASRSARSSVQLW